MSPLYTFTLLDWLRLVRVFKLSYMRKKQGNTKINISSKDSEFFDMLHVETFMRLLLDWLRFVRGIQTFETYMRGNKEIPG